MIIAFIGSLLGVAVVTGLGHSTGFLVREQIQVDPIVPALPLPQPLPVLQPVLSLRLGLIMLPNRGSAWVVS